MIGPAVAELRRDPRALARLLGWSLLAAVPALLSGTLVAAAVDEGFLAGRSGVGAAWLAGYAVAVVVGSAGARRVPVRLGRLIEPMRDRLVRSVVGGALRHAVSRAEPPDATAVSRLCGQVETVREASAGLLTGMYQVAFTVVAAAAGLFWLEPLLAALVVGPVALTLLLLAVLLRVLVARQRALLLADERMSATVSGLAEAARDVVACGGQEQAAARAAVDIGRQAAAARSAARAGALRTAIAMIGGHLPPVAILLAAPWLLRHGQVSAGEVLGAITYVSTNLQPALRSAAGTVGGQAVLLAVTLDRLAGTAQPPPPPAAPGRAPRGHDLLAERIWFSYAPGAEPVVRELTLTLRHGEHLAVVGPSGIGKSTLANLLVGVVEPQRGTVRLGGVPLAEVGERRLREAVALIPQEAYVFAGTLRENLAYLRPGADTADLDAAVDAVGLAALRERVGGYDAPLTAAALTPGERQLVALARVWLSPAEIVVLDEATCHLDPAAEARAEAALRRRHGTLVVVAHRLSSARRADRILLLDGARALLGDQRDLLARSPLYADLVREWDLPADTADTADTAVGVALPAAARPAGPP